MNTKTSPAIRAEALAYNKDFPESIAAITTGTPMIDVAAGRKRQGGIKVIISSVVEDATGGHWAASEPTVRYLKDTDGRLSPAQIAKRAAKYLGLNNSDVTINYRNLAR